MVSKTLDNRKIIIRVRGRDGTFRYEVDPNVTIGTVKSLVQKDTDVPPEHQKLSIDPKGAPLSNMTTLSQANITHGTMLFLTYDPNVVKSKQDMEIERQKEQMKKELGDMSDLRNLGLKYRSKNWTLESYNKLVEQYKIRIKHQTYAIARTAIVDRQAGQSFQQFLIDYAFQLQRVGYLYGNTVPAEKPLVDEKTLKSDMEYFDENEQYEDVQIKVIYEPKQCGGPDKFVEIVDQEEQMIRSRADALASLLDMKPVGWIFSHNGDREVPLLALEILRAAELQSKYGKTFVTVVVSPNEEGRLEFEAYQVSKQCVELYEKGLLSAHPTNPEIIVSKKEVEVERKMTTQIDCLLLTCNVAISSADFGLQVGFPIRNRPSPEYQQSMVKLKEILLERKRKNQPFVQRISDFHLLLFLTDYLSLDSDFPVLCEAIKKRNNSMIGNFENLIESYAGIQ
jgi:nuclear protein localization family protein 4